MRWLLIICAVAALTLCITGAAMAQKDDGDGVAPVNVVPVPAAIGLGALGVGIVGAVHAYRKRRRR